MFSDKLYQEYIDKSSQVNDLENKIDEYIEKWKNGETVLSTQSIELAVEKGQKRLEDLQAVVQSLYNDYMQMDVLEDQKRRADIAIRSIFGEAPSNMNIVGGVASSNASETHLIAEIKTPEQMAAEKQKMLEQLKTKVIAGEISLEQASSLVTKINTSFDFYDKETDIKSRHQ